MKKILVITTVSLLLISGCKYPEKISEKKESFIIIGINPPKHFYVDLKESNGKIHNHIFVSKHCNNWREVKLQSKVTLSVITYKNDDRIYDKIEASTICPRK